MQHCAASFVLRLASCVVVVRLGVVWVVVGGGRFQAIRSVVCVVRVGKDGESCCIDTKLRHVCGSVVCMFVWPHTQRMRTHLPHTHHPPPTASLPRPCISFAFHLLDNSFCFCLLRVFAVHCSSTPCSHHSGHPPVASSRPVCWPSRMVSLLCVARGVLLCIPVVELAAYRHPHPHFPHPPSLAPPHEGAAWVAPACAGEAGGGAKHLFGWCSRCARACVVTLFRVCPLFVDVWSFATTHVVFGRPSSLVAL